MDNAAKPVETPEVFLKALGDSLKEKEGVDADLADILRMHILKAVSVQNAVAQAKDAILKLACARANTPKSAVADG